MSYLVLIASNFHRFEDGSDISKTPTTTNGVKVKYHIDGTQIPEPSSRKSKVTRNKFLKTRVLSRVFSEDYERVKKRVLVLDPRGQIIHRWNKIFLVACLVSLFVDPLFFYLPVVREEVCIDIGKNLEIVLTIVRSVGDLFYMIQIFMKFRTAYVAPSSKVFGRGELVLTYSKIAVRYFSKGFWLDFIAALPLPQVGTDEMIFGYEVRPNVSTSLTIYMLLLHLQVLIWIIIPTLRGSTMANTKNVLRFFIIFQYIPRLYLIFPLSSQIVKATGVVTETAWAGAAYNLMLYMLASHVSHHRNVIRKI